MSFITDWEEMPEWIKEDTIQMGWSNNLSSSQIESIRELVIAVYNSKEEE